MTLGGRFLFPTISSARSFFETAQDWSLMASS